jgi:hypothetical protein
MEHPVNKAPEATRKPVLAVPGPISTTTAPAPESAPVPDSAPVAVSPVSPEISPSHDSQGREIAETIKDVAWGEFHIVKTANAWWGDTQKVHRLIDAYKIDATDEEACAYAGIRVKALEYFRQVHPDFSEVKAACKQLLKLAARDKIARAINSQKSTDDIPHLAQANWYAERKLKDEFSTRAEVVDPRAEEMKKASEDLKQLIDDVSKLTKDDTTGPEAVGARSEADREPRAVPVEGGDGESSAAPSTAPGATDPGPEAAPTVAASSPA